MPFRACRGPISPVLPARAARAARVTSCSTVLDGTVKAGPGATAWLLSGQAGRSLHQLYSFLIHDFYWASHHEQKTHGGGSKLVLAKLRPRKAGGTWKALRHAPWTEIPRRRRMGFGLCPCQALRDTTPRAAQCLTLRFARREGLRQRRRCPATAALPCALRRRGRPGLGLG